MNETARGKNRSMMEFYIIYYIHCPVHGLELLVFHCKLNPPQILWPPGALHLTPSQTHRSMWCQWHLVKSFQCPQGPSAAGGERSGCVSIGERNRASASDTVLCAVTQICPGLSKSPWTALLMPLFWTEEAEFVGEAIELNWNKNQLHKSGILAIQHRSGLWKAKLPNSQEAGQLCITQVFSSTAVWGVGVTVHPSHFNWMLPEWRNLQQSVTGP